jgi:uncharacterized membrane protein
MYDSSKTVYSSSFLVWVGTGLWVLYRIARGWMTLSSGKPMPEPEAVRGV